MRAAATLKCTASFRHVRQEPKRYQIERGVRLGPLLEVRPSIDPVSLSELRWTYHAELGMRLKQARLFTKVKRKDDEEDIRQKPQPSKKEAKEIAEMQKFADPKLADKKIVLKSTRNVLRCTNSRCKANFWNRDVNAARNMLELLRSGLRGKHGASRLRAFRRGQPLAEGEGAIPALVSLVRAGTSAQKQWAAYTLGNLAYNDDNRVEITQQGAIAPLVKLLQAGTDAQKQWAAYALGNLACDNDAVAELDDAILPLVELVRGGSDTQKQEAAYTLGNLAASSDDNRAEIGREGGIAPLVELLFTGNDDQRQWAAYALACVAQNNDENRAAIVNEGAIAPLLELILSGTGEQKAQAVRAIGSLASENNPTQVIFPAEEVVKPLVGFPESECCSSADETGK